MEFFLRKPEITNLTQPAGNNYTSLVIFPNGIIPALRCVGK